MFTASIATMIIVGPIYFLFFVVIMSTAMSAPDNPTAILAPIMVVYVLLIVIILILSLTCFEFY